MDFQATLDYLFNQLPMYQRIGIAAYKTDLSNTIALCEILGNPERSFKSIHIAGTNGKGSTSHMLASVLQEAGYKVGLYTSPHLKDFRERIKINGQMIPEQDVVQFVNNFKDRFEGLGMSFFEWTVGLAFHYFEKQQVDIAVVETGLGGRLDSTNVLEPELSVITNIGMDHTQFLGESLSEIAGEKAGIIKKGIPVIIGEKQQEIEHIFIDKANDCGAELTFASDTLLTNSTDLKGLYQQSNLLTAQSAIGKMQELGWEISETHIKEGFNHVVRNTGFLGRWQELGKSPTVICDTGHNEDGMRYIVEQLHDQVYNELHIVFGVVDDKQLDHTLGLLPKAAHYYFCQANIQRALDSKVLCNYASKFGLTGSFFGSVKEALNAAKSIAHANDLIFIGGSTFVVAEVV